MWVASDHPQHHMISVAKTYEADSHRDPLGTSTLRQQFTLYDMGLQASHVPPTSCLATLMNTVFCSLYLFRYAGPWSSLSGNWFWILYISVHFSSSRKFSWSALYFNWLRPVDGFCGFIILNLLQLPVPYKSTVLLHEDQPQGAIRLKKEDQIDQGFHRD